MQREKDIHQFDKESKALVPADKNMQSVLGKRGMVSQLAVVGFDGTRSSLIEGTDSKRSKSRSMSKSTHLRDTRQEK